jgi:glyoxylase-like metal-dependent hydrolase (beta-lactamase superfamily II)
MADIPAPASIDILTVGYAEPPSVAGTVGLVRDGDRIIVVDPGMVRSRSLILDPIARHDLTPNDVTHVFVSHHHLDHTVNIALFPNAEIVDFRSARHDDHVDSHQGEGYKLGPNTTVWVTPGHSPQDASLVVARPRSTPIPTTRRRWPATAPAFSTASTSSSPVTARPSA